MYRIERKKTNIVSNEKKTYRSRVIGITNASPDESLRLPGVPGFTKPVLQEPSTGLGRRSQVGFRVHLKVVGVLGVSLSSAKFYLYMS